jgi:hypothetical protein
MWLSVQKHCRKEQHGAGAGIGVEVVTEKEFLLRSRGNYKATAQTMGEMAAWRNRNAMRLLHDVLDHLADSTKVFIHLSSPAFALSP